jgi:hypothetical protein
VEDGFGDVLLVVRRNAEDVIAEEAAEAEAAQKSARRGWKPPPMDPDEESPPF